MGKLKQSYNQYRNIDGKHFIMNTHNPLLFEEVKADCKKRKLAHRMINEQLFTEVPKDGQ